jgi:hypothetical protein
MNKYIITTLAAFTLLNANANANTNTNTNTGNICYVQQYNRLLWQKMEKPQKLGSACVMYNGSFVPIYEGRTGLCQQGLDCNVTPRNVDLGRKM